MSAAFTVVAILTIKPGASAQFQEFETAAARLIARHGGSIVHTVTVPGEPMREVHLVVFADEDAFGRYRADPDLAALAGLRASCIAHTEVLIGHAGPDYHGLR